MLELEFADATTALWSENAGAHPAGATLSADFEIQNLSRLAMTGGSFLDLSRYCCSDVVLAAGRQHGSRAVKTPGAWPTHIQTLHPTSTNPHPPYQP